ncbi:hypothetical protein C8263_15420 [Deinococcus arcticus]|uniref:Uncharacterized protein n=2 Tax=Deinococcus arcticus TaxID=2136176 RepID=A0A2T3W4X8_9DEIO|nr:hypothetical protein C8263_15420 [Deinococcus arcticus]
MDFVLAASEHEPPILEVTAAKATALRKLPVIPEGEQGSYHLLAASALRLLTSHGQALASKGTYRLVTDPKIGQMALEGVKGSPGLYRGFSRSGGKITQHAKFKPIKGAKLATLGLAAFEVATIVTSTVHLQEIGKQLKQVNETLDQLQDLLDDQRIGRLQGNLTYLTEILSLLELGTLTSSDSARYGDQLETIYRECLAEIQTADKQLVRRQKELAKAEKVRLKGVVVWKQPSKADQAKLTDRVKDFSSSLEIALLAQETAVMTCAVGTQLRRSPMQMEFRLRQLERQIDQLKANWKIYGDVLKTKFEGVAERESVRTTELAPKFGQSRVETRLKRRVLHRWWVLTQVAG